MAEIDTFKVQGHVHFLTWFELVIRVKPGLSEPDSGTSVKMPQHAFRAFYLVHRALLAIKLESQMREILSQTLRLRMQRWAPFNESPGYFFVAFRSLLPVWGEHANA